MIEKITSNQKSEDLTIIEMCNSFKAYVKNGFLGSALNDSKIKKIPQE